MTRKQNHFRKWLFVPREDTQCVKWLQNQESVSFSIRYLIHDYIEKNGISDPHNKSIKVFDVREDAIEEDNLSSNEISNDVKSTSDTKEHSQTKLKKNVVNKDNEDSLDIGVFLSTSRD